MGFASDTFRCGFLGTSLALLDLFQVQHAADPAKVLRQFTRRQGRKLFGPVAAFRKRLGCPPRSYGHSNHIDNQRCEPNESGIVGWFFLVSCGDSSAPLDPTKESFDLVAISVECLVVSLLDSSCRMGLDADFGIQLSPLISQGIGIVRCIGNHGSDSPLRQNGQQAFSLRSISALPRGQDKVNQFSVAACYSMYLGRQSAATSPKASPLVGITFFSPSNRWPVEAI